MHTLKVGVLDVSGVEGGYSFDLFRSVAFPGCRRWRRFVISLSKFL